MTAHADKKRRDNIAESTRMVADALEAMEGAVKAQDTAIEKIIGIARNGIRDANVIAADAASNAEKAKLAAVEALGRIQRFETLTFWQRLVYLFRGRLP